VLEVKDFKNNRTTNRFYYIYLFCVLRISPFRPLDNPPTRISQLNSLRYSAEPHSLQPAPPPSRLVVSFIITLFLIITPTVLSPHFSSPISFQSPLFLILPFIPQNTVSLLTKINNNSAAVQRPIP